MDKYGICTNATRMPAVVECFRQANLNSTKVLRVLVQFDSSSAAGNNVAYVSWLLCCLLGRASLLANGFKQGPRKCNKHETG